MMKLEYFTDCALICLETVAQGSFGVVETVGTDKTGCGFDGCFAGVAIGMGREEE